MHGAFAGYTGVTAGLVNTHYVRPSLSAVHQQLQLEGCRAVCDQSLALQGCRLPPVGQEGAWPLSLACLAQVYLPIPVIISSPRRVRPESAQPADAAGACFVVAGYPSICRLPANACTATGLRAAPLQVDPHGKTWNRLRASIGQPTFMDKPLVRHSGHNGVVTAGASNGQAQHTAAA